jgi:NlpC/P60 family
MPQTTSSERGRSPHGGAGPARFAGCFTYTHADAPARTLAFDAHGEWVATFTEGARTVTLAGPCRTFSDPTAASPVTTHVWVRLLEEPFAGEVDEGWLEARLADTAPDLLDVATQYLAGAPPLYDDGGLQVAGDASYGPLQADGTRQEGSDFNDYLGIPWTYPDGTRDRPEAHQLQCLDCSGFVRMVWGYRGGLPLSLSVLEDGSALPRRAFQMYEGGPGTLLIANTGQQVTDFSVLAPGDLLFFDASQDDGDRLDHVGIYLGVDEGGRHRFLSSRKGADGPTLGDAHGSSVLDGPGLYARSSRAALRL